MSRAPLCDQTRRRSLHWSAHPGAAALYQAATAHPPSLLGLWRRDEKWSVVLVSTATAGTWILIVWSIRSTLLRNATEILDSFRHLNSAYGQGFGRHCYNHCFRFRFSYSSSPRHVIDSFHGHLQLCHWC